jgi:hypothetical protein
MSFKLTKSDLKKSVLCPPGMHSFTLTTIDEPYLKTAKNGTATTVQKCDFETNEGYTVSVWFNSVVMQNLFEFVAAADKVAFKLEDFTDTDVELKDYLNKKVSGSVSHRKTDDGKIVAQIDNFYIDGKVPY